MGLVKRLSCSTFSVSIIVCFVHFICLVASISVQYCKYPVEYQCFYKYARNFATSSKSEAISLLKMQNFNLHDLYVWDFPTNTPQTGRIFDGDIGNLHYESYFLGFHRHFSKTDSSIIFVSKEKKQVIYSGKNAWTEHV